MLVEDVIPVMEGLLPVVDDVLPLETDEESTPAHSITITINAKVKPY